MIICSNCGKAPVRSKGLCRNCDMNRYYKNNESYRKYVYAKTIEFQKNNPEKVKQYAKNTREKHKKELNLKLKKRRQENPNMVHAHYVVQSKLKLYKPERCEICNKKIQLEAHHPDYSKPFLVIWCCLGCHAIFRTKFREGEQIALF